MSGLLSFIFNNTTKFSRLNEDPATTRLNTLQNYLFNLQKRDEISESKFKFMRPKAASFGCHTCPILRYATDGKNVLTIGKYEYRFVTCSAKRNVISLLGAGGVRFKILSNGTTGTIGKIWLPIVKLILPSLNYVQIVAKVDILMRIEGYIILI